MITARHRRPDRQASRRWHVAVVAAAVYLALWAVTRSAGTAAVERSLVQAVDGGAGSVRVPGRDALDRFERPSYYVRTSSPLPLIVFADYGQVCGPLCGQGGSAFVLWLPGVANPPRLYVSQWWR